MHPYATDSGERKTIFLLIAATSIGLAYLLSSIIVKLDLTVLWWIDVPSVMGFYGLIYLVFDKYVWRIPFLRKVGLVKVPNLNGIWKGSISSSYDEHKPNHDATLVIQQSWSTICILFETEQSRSHSLIASLLTENPIGPLLSYEYSNEPKPSAKGTMHVHKGTAWLTLKQDNLVGEYYTGRDRSTFGSFTFEKRRGGLP